ncbi:MAG: hypothetical protein ACFCD0_21225 [Gemmataceae bacterium]
MTDSLQEILETIELSADVIADHRNTIYDATLKDSRYMKEGNFKSFHPEDLHRMYTLYDELFYEHQLEEGLADLPITFGISKKMTKAGGKTTRHWKRGKPHVATRFEISFSAPLLFQTFQDVQRDVSINGVLCHDRLEALQLVFEHELTHLSEFLIWDKSSCKGNRFQSVATRMFGHVEYTHQLITQAERALSKYQIRVGDIVSFEYGGEQHVGLVNRITKRVTVLVQSSNGERYNDGKRYAKYYVPLDLLTKVESGVS